VQAARLHGITLVSPLLLDHSAQARAGAGHDKAAFTFDFDAHQATCPQQVPSSSWSTCTQRGAEAIVQVDALREWVPTNDDDPGGLCLAFRNRLGLLAGTWTLRPDVAVVALLAHVRGTVLVPPGWAFPADAAPSLLACPHWFLPPLQAMPDTHDHVGGHRIAGGRRW
jgi:hypothetical protein